MAEVLDQEEKEIVNIKKSEEASTVITKEKVVYKVVHVPYYYPVPVDADYYYQNQDRFLRHRERFDERLFDNVPPPHPHHHHHHRRSREYSHRESYPSSYRLSRSPSPTLTSKGRFISARSPSSSPPQRKEKVSESPPKHTEEESKILKEGEKDEKVETEINTLETVSAEIIKTEKESDDEAMIKEANNNNESFHEEKHRNRRKRYLMTFPYDQKLRDGKDIGRYKDNYEIGRKKTRHESLDLENELPIEIESRRYHDIPHKRSNGHYFASHPPSPPPHAPYVMVPMRPLGASPDYLHERHDRHYKEDEQDYISGKYREMDADKNSDEMNSDKMIDEEDDGKDVRYHSNGRRVRTVFSRQQLLTLNNVFQKHPFVSGERMSELSKQLGLDRKIVKIWFQNKRQNARKKGSLFERADDYYYEYHQQDRYSNRSSPPTMAENW